MIQNNFGNYITNSITMTNRVILSNHRGPTHFGTRQRWVELTDLGIVNSLKIDTEKLVTDHPIVPQ